MGAKAMLTVPMRRNRPSQLTIAITGAEMIVKREIATTMITPNKEDIFEQTKVPRCCDIDTRLQYRPRSSWENSRNKMVETAGQVKAWERPFIPHKTTCAYELCNREKAIFIIPR